MQSRIGEQGSSSAISDTSVNVAGGVEHSPESESRSRRKRHLRVEATLQAEDLQSQIALEEYLGALDIPAAIIHCFTGDNHDGAADPGSPSTSIGSSPRPGNYLGAPRPRLVRMTSSNGSSWPTTYGSTDSSTGASTHRIPARATNSSLFNNGPESSVTPPKECRFVWGNRYTSMEMEELLLEELNRDGLLQKVWSTGSGRNKKIHTLASRHSTERRISWTVTPIRNGRYLTLTGQEEEHDPSGEGADPARVEPGPPNSSQRWLRVPGETEETRRHSELFGSVDWGNTPLGSPERWPQSLLTMVNLCLASPFPVLISWGPEKILLYNEPYSKVIGVKHPAILGMRYKLAWPEVWEALEPVIDGAMDGQVVHVDNAQMFLNRGNYLEETYFTWSMIPLRGATGSVEGLFIPNFDNTGRLISERRIHTLNILSRAVAEARSAEQIASITLPAFENNNDIPFMIMYLASPAEEENDHESLEKQSVRTRSTSVSSRRLSTTSDDNCLEFQLAGHVGCIDIQENDPFIPRTVVSDRQTSTSEYGDLRGLAKYIRMAHCHEDAIVISADDDLRDVLPNITPNAFGDLTQYVAVMPVRTSAEDRTHGVIVLGLNSRMEYTKAYKDYINTMRGLLATGLASVKLHGEQMARAQYLAALNKRKNDELQVLLKKKTEELRSAELKLSTAFECCPTGIWIANKDHEIVFLNPAYYHITGLHPDAPLSDWIDLVHPDDVERVRTIYAESRYKRSKAEFRLLTGGTNPDGTPEIRWVESTAGPPYDSIGQVCGTISDITHRKEKEEYQVRRAEDALERKRQQEYFIDMTSHELRNPLSAICLAVEGIVDRIEAVAKESGPSQQAELRDLIKDHDVVILCTQHMKRLIDDVLSLSKLDSDMLVVTSVACHPLAFTREVLSMFQPELKCKSIACSFTVQDGYRDLVPQCVKVDPQRVTQVLINLLTNAIKFTSNAATKKIACTLDASRHRPRPHSQEDDPMAEDPSADDALYLIWSIQDTGPGVSEDESKRLFKRFQQAQPRTHVTYGGSGLGLFISKKLTKLLGGDIFLKSQSGVGSTFTFYVRAETYAGPPELTGLADGSPLSESPQTKTMAKTPGPKALAKANEPMPQRKLQVLLTEDNLINQQLLQRQLVKAGCTVFVANNGKEALDFVVQATSHLDCILMDVEMPIMGGLECAREIRRRGINTPIIAVTANARSEQVDEIMSSGMNAAVAKPFSTSDLMKQMWQLVSNKVAESLDESR